MLFSGSAFVLAMLGMVLVPDTILRSLATGAVLVGIVTVLAALTLLPAVLALLGDRVNALRVPWLGRRAQEQAGAEGRVWSRVVRSVTRAPVRAAVISIGVLLLVAAPLLSIQTGLTGVRELPNRFHAKRGFTMLEQEFGVGTPDSVQVVVGGDVRSAPLRQAIAELARRIGAEGAFLQPEVSTSPDGRVANVEALVAGDSRDERALTAVQGLRTKLVPEVFAGRDATVYVTGETAEVLDYRALTDEWLPIVFVFVLGLSFVLLTVAFRSIVLAAVAIGLNLLSVGAAYGLIVLVFLKGFGRDLLGFTEVDVIAAWLPLFLFAVLFGLSMDYTVFLLSRIREHVARGRADDRGGRARRRVDRADHHRRRADHHRGVRGVRRRRPGGVPGDGLRHRRLPADRRDGRAARAAPRGARDSRRAHLVPRRAGSAGSPTSRSRARRVDRRLRPGPSLQGRDALPEVGDHLAGRALARLDGAVQVALEVDRRVLAAEVAVALAARPRCPAKLVYWPTFQYEYEPLRPLVAGPEVDRRAAVPLLR